MKPFRQLTIVASGLLCASISCFAIPHLSIPRLVSQSTLIVVARVGQVHYVGPAEVPFNGKVLPGGKYRAEAVALYPLSGNGPAQFTIEFAIPAADVGYGSVRPGVRMLFLKGSGPVYAPADPYYPDPPALSSPPPELQGKTVTEQVLAELGAVVASPDASPTDRRDVLFWSYAIPDSYKSFLSDVSLAIQNTSDPELRWKLEAELMTRNDISRFPDVCTALLSGTVPVEAQHTVLYAIASRLNNDKALPGLKQLLRSTNPEIRVASAQAFWHIASPASVGALIEALQDENPDVRYYAIRALADITGQPQWGPGPEEYQQHEARYLEHWQEWANENRPRPNN